VTFQGRRAPGEEQSEFLASSDNWFRPVFAQTGPDGALWIADMYRHVIEHPEWIPKETQKKLDLRAGHDKGRICRVYPVDKKPRPIPRLDKLDTAGLVAALDSPNGWQRDMAMMMLVSRCASDSEPEALARVREAVPLLEKLLSTADRPQTRAQAMCALDVLGEAHWKHLARGFNDSNPGVRRHAVRLLAENTNKIAKGFDELPLHQEYDAALQRLLDDPDPQVRMQLAYSLGHSEDRAAARFLGQLVVKSAGDRYLAAATMSSINAVNIEAVALAVLENASLTRKAESPQLLGDLLRMAHSFGNRKVTAAVLKHLIPPKDQDVDPWQCAALADFLDVLEAQQSSLAQLAKEADPGLSEIIQQLKAHFAWARGVASAHLRSPPEFCLIATRLLGRGLEERAEDRELLEGFLTPHQGTDVQVAAVRAIGRQPDASGSRLLLRRWKLLTPPIRSQVVGVLIRHPQGVNALLEAIESKAVLALDIDAARRQRLLDHEKPEIRDRAAKVFVGVIDRDRQKIIDGYKSALTAKGEAAKGQSIFAKTCASCHKLAGVGNDVGPDLGAMKDKSRAALLEAILDPNRALEARYVNYLCTTANGQTLSGLLASETSNSITLVTQDGKPQTVLRNHIEQLASTGKSAMPEGLEKDIKPEQMADLLAFLTSNLPPGANAPGSPLKRKEFVGNQPELVKPDANSVLKLTAKNCEIYGTSLVFEPQFTNLGWWTKEDDHAVWNIDVPRAAKFEVHFDYACHDSAAGDTFALTIGEQRLTGKVAGTGTWENYRQVKVGEVELVAGQQRVVMRSAGPIRSALIDLRVVRLARAK
jgi:putative heme-binding domain-containing protein